jgi:uncharacterized protein with von Willebrand factor type A (vWA) domain
MSGTVLEIIGRVPPPPPPPGDGPGQPGGQPGEGEGQGQQPTAPNGPGGHPGDDPNGNNQQGQGQQPAPEGGQPQGPGNTPAPSNGGDGGDEDGDGQDGGQAPGEFDPDSEGDAEDQAETDWENDFDNLLDDLDIDRAMNRALDEAAQEAEELDNMRRGIGLEDGEWRLMSPEQRLAMAERLSTPEMKELASVVGRMKRFALGVKATRINDVPHEVYNVENGNDLRRILRSEYGLLATPETSYEFYRRYADGELLQFKMRGSEEAGKGPIVCLIDKSGSMSGSPFNWAMGVSEALRRFAADEDRDFYAIFFGFNNDRERFDFPQGKGPFEKVLTFLSVDPNGGTAFDGVLTEGLDKASNSFDGESKGKADIVFITDGMANLSDEWIDGFNAERERVGVRVYSVYIGGAYDMSGNRGPAALLGRISDAVIPVKDLRPEAAELIFQKV